VAGDLCGEQGWYGEETLDVEAVHAMAPGASVVFSGAASCDDFDILDALNRIVAGHLADVVSNSYGSIGEDVSQAEFRATDAVFAQAAAEGIGLTFSTGDDGDESANTQNGKPVADFEATHPMVTAVGGTSLAVTGANAYGFETGWATGLSALGPFKLGWKPTPPGDFLYGAGGGVSSVFAQPAYQAGVVPASVTTKRRAIPDVAADGDPNTGMLVGETQTFPDGAVRYGEYRLGGTSLSSPLFAGIMALADQRAGHALGFVNPRLYQLKGTAALRDVVPATPRAVVRNDYVNTVDASDGVKTTLRTLDDEAQTLHTAAGWDTITGLGTPNGSAFLSALGQR
jgi:subtilase family serine protease